LVYLAILLLILASLDIGYAQGASPGDPVNDAAGLLVRILASLGGLFIQVAYALMFLVFAVGFVRSGLGALVAQQLGVTGQLSQELIKIVLGVVIFVVALMSLPLVNFITSRVTEQIMSGGGWNFDIYIPIPFPGE